METLTKGSKFLIYLFSFFLGFGKFDPFDTDRIYFSILIIIMLVNIIITSRVLQRIKLFSYEIILLVIILIIFSLANMAYLHSGEDDYYFNFKFLSAIIIFWVLSFSFRDNPKLVMNSLLLFAVSCSLIAVFYNFGFLSSYGQILNGRLRIFDENPNSISTRMALSATILSYIIIDNPINYSRIRYLLVLAIPSLFLFVVDSGSRGSFILILLGIGLVVIFSKVKKIYKIFLISFILLFFLNIIFIIQDSGLLIRFENEDLSGGRELIWGNALEIYNNHIWGVGEGGFVTEMKKKYSDYHDTHNLLLYMLVSGGFVSLILFLMFLWHLLNKVILQLKYGDSISLVLFGFMFFLFSKTGGVLTYLLMWYCFAVINSFSSSNLKEVTNTTLISEK